MLKPLVPKFRSALSSRLKDITEKQVPAKLKPIVEVKQQGHASPPETLTKQTHDKPTIHCRKFF